MTTGQAETTTGTGGVGALARFLAETCELPPAVLRHAALVVLDTVGVILAGSREPEAARLVTRLGGLGTPGAATVLAEGFPRVDPPLAAFLNGTAGTFLELDEGHRPTGHPGIHAVPPALALGEALGASGQEVLRAVVLGYEAQTRLSAACRLRRGVHPHGSLGIVGAAATCGVLLGLAAKATSELLQAAASLALAPPFSACVEGATIRNSYAGVGAQLGLQAALMVESGFTALSDGLGETFGRLVGEHFDPALLGADLGEPFEITRNYFKFHACCAYNHPALDAVTAILSEERVEPDAVEAIEIRTLPHFATIDQTHPSNQLAAKFSIPYAVAVAICHRSTWVDAFRLSPIQDAQAHELAERVRVVGDPALAARWPAEAPATVVVRLREGRELTGRCTNPRGSFGNPSPLEEIGAKFARLTAPVFPGRGADEAREVLLGLGDATRAGVVTDRLRALGTGTCERVGLRGQRGDEDPRW